MGYTAGIVALVLVGAPVLPHPEAAEQTRRRPRPETYHWVLPAQHGGVEVADLHPGDCYVIQEAEGMVYFGEPWPELTALQAELGDPISHLVETSDEHPECLDGLCLQLARVRAALTVMEQALSDEHAVAFWRRAVQGAFALVLLQLYHRE